VIKQPVIVFDLFGVIARTQTPEHKLRIEEIAGVPSKSLWQTYWDLRRPYDAGQPATEYWAAVAGGLGTRFDAPTVDRLIEADLASWTEVDDTMVALVGELAEQGRKLGLLSNIIGELVPIFEARHGGWLSHFAALTYSCDIGVAKPDHEAFEICAKRLGVVPGDCLFFDDSEVNVVGAREVGMRAEVFRSPDQVRAAVFLT
jgi:putative hydrolase of the HAD superfamily